MNEFLAFCEPCNYKKIITKNSEHEHISRAKVPGGIPYMDVETKSIKEKKGFDQPTMIKCPNCGRGVILKRLPEAYTKAQDSKLKLEQEMQKSLKSKVKEERFEK